MQPQRERSMGGPAGQNGTHPHLTYAVGSLHYPMYLTVQGGPRCGRGPDTLLEIGSKSRSPGWGVSEYGGMGTDLWHRHHAPVLPWGFNRGNYPPRTTHPFNGRVPPRGQHIAILLAILKYHVI